MVIIPNLVNGITSEKIKLKKPIAVVIEVKKTGTPIFLLDFEIIEFYQFLRHLY